MILKWGLSGKGRGCVWISFVRCSRGEDPEVFERRNTVGTLLQDRSIEDRARYYYYLPQGYTAAGLYERALLYLRRALEEGIRKNKVLKDAAFEPLWENLKFQLLVSNPPDADLPK